MVSYRFEYASTSRAGCKTTECQRNGVKIEKGALRFGTWVEIQGHGSWQWRHWGCVTAKQIENLKGTLDGGSLEDQLDGYEDMSGVDQQRISKAIREGHIVDADCFSIDPETNRPGAKEAAKEAAQEAAKRAKAEEKAARDAAKAADKERQKAIKEAEKAQKAAAREAAKEAAKLKKEAEKAEKEAIKLEKAASKGKKRTKKESESDGDGANNESIELEEAAPPVKRAKATKVKHEQEAGTDGLVDQVKPEDAEEHSGNAAATAKTSKKGRTAKVKKEQETDANGEEHDEDIVVRPAKASTKGRAAKVKEEIEPTTGSRRSVRNRK